MKKFTLIITALILSISFGYSQILKPVTWEVGSKKVSKDEVVVFIKAKIQSGWHIYGQNVPDGGPIATTFTFTNSKGHTLVGKVQAPAPKSKFENTFKMDVPYYDKEVVFQQKVKLKGKSTVVEGTVEFMSCDKTQCLPPDDYTFKIAI